MKKISILLLILSLSIAGFGQHGDVNANRLFIKDRIKFKDYWLTGIQRDTSFTDSAKVPTSLAVRKFVEGRIAGVSGGGATPNLNAVSLAGNTTTIPLRISHVTVGSVADDGTPSAYLFSDTTNRVTGFGFSTSGNPISSYNPFKFQRTTFGIDAGALGAGRSIVAFGYHTLKGNAFDNVSAFGDSAGVDNVYQNVTLLGKKAQATSDGQIVLSNGQRSLFLTLADNVYLNFRSPGGDVAFLGDIPPNTDTSGIELNDLSVNSSPTTGAASYNPANGEFTIPKLGLDGTLRNNNVTDYPAYWSDGGGGAFGIMSDGSGGFMAVADGPSMSTQIRDYGIQFSDPIFGTPISKIVPDPAASNAEFTLPQVSGRAVISVNGVVPDANGNVTVSGGGGGGSVSWGSITGSLGDQTDLYDKFNSYVGNGDTASMLSPYLRAAIAAATYSPISHNHDASYSAIGHNHSYDLLTNVSTVGKTDGAIPYWDSLTATWKVKRGLTKMVFPLRAKKTAGANDSVDIWMPPHTMLVNNRGDSGRAQLVAFVDTTGTYTGALTWSGSSAPSGTPSHWYSLAVRGKKATMTVFLNYSTPGSGNTGVTLTLPPGAPAPAVPPGLGSANQYLPYSCFAHAGSSPNSLGNGGRAVMKVNGDATGYEVQINISSTNASVTFFTMDYTLN